MTWDYRAIERSITETKRQMHMSEFERVNERAADHHADAWLAYCPLTRNQLFDEPDLSDRLTLDVGVFGQFIVLRRPTENRAMQFPSTRKPLKPIERSQPDQWRWCIFCHERHPKSAFLRHKRYLHHLSYACKDSLKRARRRHWFYAPVLDTSRIIYAANNR